MTGWKLLYFLFALTIVTNSSAQEWKKNLDSANVYKALKKFDEAIVFFVKAKKELKKDSLLTDTYVMLNKSIGDLYYVSGEGNAGVPYYEEARGLSARIHSTPVKEYAEICNTLGVIYQLNNQLDTALALHKAAKKIREQLFGTSNAAYAQSCNNIGGLYLEMGDYELAEPELLKAKEIREKLPPAKRVPVYAITCTALANLYSKMGKYEEAEALYIEAKKVRADTFTIQHPLYAYSCNILADLYYYMQKFDKAEPLYLEAKKIREGIGKETHEYAETLNNLASLYRDMGKYDKAEPLALEAKSIFEKIPGDQSSVTINLNNLGELYYAMGDYKKSEEYFGQSRSQWAKAIGKDHPYYISNSDEMIRLYRSMNEIEKVNNFIAEVSLSKYRQLEKIFRFTNENEKQLYLENINGSADEYQSFYYSKMSHDKAGLPYNLSLLNRNLILSSTQQMRQAIYSSGDASLGQLYEKWTSNRQQLAKLYSRGTEINNEQQKTLEEKNDKLEKELSRKSNAFKKNQNAGSWKNIQQDLKENEAAIEFIEFQLRNDKDWTDSTFYAAVLIRKNQPEPVLIPLFEKRQLEAQLSKKNINEKEKIQQQYKTPDLYNLIWSPVEQHLKGITKIYFAPAGDLHKVSIAALRTSANETVSDKYQLVQLLTTSSAIEKGDVKLAAGDKIFLYGAVQYDADSVSLLQAAMRYNNNGSLAMRSIEEFGNKDDFKFFQTLLNSGPEIDGIAKAALEKKIETISYKGAEANEESVKALNENPSSFVLHISTHGFFFPDPSANKSNNNFHGKVFRQSANPFFRSGLVMAGAERTWNGKQLSGIEDGILTAYEVSNMYFPHNKLVVLSACETGLGDLHGSEGVYGLQRAFKMAGAQNLVMSLWKVPDAQTAEFMQLFYINMFNNQSISDAFYQTQNSMKRKYRNDPFNWAAWVLVR